MIYKIVQGNSFKLHILVRKLDMSMDFNRLVDFDLTKATDIKVELACCFSEPIAVTATVSGILGNVLVCDIPSTLDLGRYDVLVSWKYNDYDMVSRERGILQIVSNNAKVKLPIGIVHGETSGLFDLRYYIVTENQSLCPITYVLDDVSLSSSPDKIANGEKFETTINPSEGFNIGLVKVIMDGNDITKDVFSGNKISIPAVSGYLVIMVNGDNDVFYYGATSASGIEDFNIEDLTRATGDLVGKSITVTTTEDAPYIWFITRVPVVFYQSGFEAAMNQTKLGDLYYYWSDELVPGDDNEYNIKLKE